jgi:hypothetical protein
LLDIAIQEFDILDDSFNELAANAGHADTHTSLPSRSGQ